MRRFTRLLRLIIRLARTLMILLVDAGRFLLLCLRPSPALAAENLFLRKQLALYHERHVKPGRATNTTCWRTFVRNHAQAIVACDFCVVVTATFRILYVFVVMEHSTRRILHANLTAHPTAQWTMQQLRDALPADHAYGFLMHDRDTIFSQEFD